MPNPFFVFGCDTGPPGFDGASSRLMVFLPPGSVGKGISLLKCCTMDLEKLPLPELRKLLSAVNDELSQREAVEKNSIRQALEQLAAKGGQSLGKLLDEAEKQIQRIPKR